MSSCLSRSLLAALSALLLPACASDHGAHRTGAVKGAADAVELGNLTASLTNLAPALEAARARIPGEHSSRNKTFLDAAVEENVRLTCRDILDRSPVLAEMVETGDLLVVGAVYDLSTGAVRWLDH